MPNDLVKPQVLITLPNELTSATRCEIRPGEVGIIPLKEKIALPSNVGGVMGIRKLLGREFVTLCSTVINAGHNGGLEAQLENKSGKLIEIREDEAILNVIFFPVIQEVWGDAVGGNPHAGTE